MVHVPFKGVAESTTALLGSHIHAIADSTGWAPQVNKGKFRLLVSMSQLDQERFYLDSEDYRAFAMQQIVQEKKMVEELQLRGQ